MCASYTKPPANGNFIKHQNSADVVCDYANFFEKIVFWFLVPYRFNNNNTYVFVFFYQTLKLIDAVVRKRKHGTAKSSRYAFWLKPGQQVSIKRFTRSGGEAMAVAVRIARAASKKE